MIFLRQRFITLIFRKYDIINTEACSLVYILKGIIPLWHSAAAFPFLFVAFVEKQLFKMVSLLVKEGIGNG